MGQLREGKTMKVVIDGVDLSMNGFYLITNDDAFQFNFGLKQSTVKTNTNSFRPPQVKGVKRECPTFTFTLTKLSYGTEMPLSITDDELSWLGRLLYKLNEEISIECNGKLCEGYVLDSNDSWLNTYNQGYINVTFEMSSPYFYSSIISNERVVLDDYTLNVYNKSNVNEDVYPNFVINNINATEITIRNINGKSMTISGLKPNTVYKVYNEKRSIFNDSDFRDNVYTGFTGDWISLRYGKNTFKLSSNGRLEFKILHRNKYVMS